MAAETADRDDSTEIAPASTTAGETTPAAHHPTSQALAAPRQPALDRPDRPAQFPRRFFVGAPLQVAEDDRRTIPIRQLREFFVKDRAVSSGASSEMRVAASRAALLSCARAAAAPALEADATRQATPWSQGPNDSPTQSDPALRARIKKVAWNASWAS